MGITRCKTLVILLLLSITAGNAQRITNDSIFIFSISIKNNTSDVLSNWILIDTDSMIVDATNYFSLKDIPCVEDSSVLDRCEMFLKTNFVKKFMRDRSYFHYTTENDTMFVKCWRVLADYIIVGCNPGSYVRTLSKNIETNYQIYFTKVHSHKKAKRVKNEIEPELKRIFQSSPLR